MQPLNRDLLVVSKKNGLNKIELEKAIISLNNVLYKAESFNAICLATQVADLNKYKMHSSFKKVAQCIKFESNKPFVFFLNKN